MRTYVYDFFLLLRMDLASRLVIVPLLQQNGRKKIIASLTPVTEEHEICTRKRYVQI